jgi:hypothetical protein
MNPDVQMCPNLEELQLVRCFDPPAQGVAPLQPGQFGHLRALSLGDESLSFRPACVNERYLEALLDALPQLEALHCSQIYDVARLTNDQAARRLKVLITATTENSQIALLKSALKRTAATLQVLSVPTAIREAWGAGEVGFVPLSNEDCSELIALLALGLPSLRFLRFPTGRLSDLTQFLTDVETSRYCVSCVVCACVMWLCACVRPDSNYMAIQRHSPDGAAHLADRQLGQAERNDRGGCG